MIVSAVRHDWPEKAGFLAIRPKGHPQYTFMHFTTSVQFKFGDTLVQARPGACIFYAPRVPQWYHSPRDIIHNWLHADEGLGALLEAYAIPQNEIFYPENPAFISDIFRQIEIEHFSDNPHKEALIAGYVNEFLIKLSRALHGGASGVQVQRQEREQIRAVRQRILSEPDRKWSVSEMAALASLSTSRFHAVYKALFATSPLQDVIEAKIRYARSLLLSDERLSIAEVAEKLGYNDPYHFIRQFKAVTGKTPGAYRKSRK